MDGTRKANSGHPGGAMSSADFATILYMDYLKFAPQYPKWHNRDRFVLSAGHESMLMYSLLNLAGMLSMDELKNFRQFGSLTPGHPESHLTPGVEATTGPLGQGISMAVGMAIAAKHQQAELGKDVIDNTVYVLVGDGDLQESVAIGTSAIAGHLNLDNLVVFYDKNDIQISGKTSRSDSTDFDGLFKAIGWEVRTINGHNHTEIRAALDYSKNKREKPLLIIGQTVIANGTATMEGSHKTHGEPLKPEEIAATKTKLGLDPEQSFHVTEEVYAHFRRNLNTYNAVAENWEAALADKCSNAEFKAKWDGFFNNTWNFDTAPEFPVGESMASRKAFGMCLEHAAKNLSSLMGGSADLEPSNNTEAFAKVVGEFSRDNRSSRNLAFGVREFSMACIQNGMALYGGMMSFGATFLTFADYSRNAIRMSALQELQTLHVFTHDSIFLGEDGPTHQPIEHVMSLRVIPNLLVLRPGDARETLESMKVFVRETHRPSLLALSRQNLPTLDGPCNVSKGGYVKFETKPGTTTDTVIFATGSELHVAIEAAKALNHANNVRVVSVPCWELFWEQDAAYRNEVLTLEAKNRISVEAGVTLGWQKFTGADGLNIGVDTFGASAPAEKLAEHFGLTVPQITERIQAYVGR